MMTCSRCGGDTSQGMYFGTICPVCGQVRSGMVMWQSQFVPRLAQPGMQQAQSSIAQAGMQQAHCHECGHDLGDWTHPHEPGCKIGEAYYAGMLNSGDAARAYASSPAPVRPAPLWRRALNAVRRKGGLNDT